MTTFRQWIPSLTMLLVSLISYIDRNTLALLAPTILHETGLNAEQYGWIISIFSVAYMTGNPIWGRLLDRLGLREGMFASVSFWTLASAAHVFASGFWSFAVARAALGFGEGATFPGGLRTAVQTLPIEKRSRGIAVSYSGGSLGAVVTPIIVTPIALAFGWRGAFLFTGAIGVAWLIIWSFVSRRPELRTKPEAHSAARPVAQGPGWFDPRTWAFMGAYALGAMPLGFILYGTSIYLSRALGASQAEVGMVLWVPPLGWEAGYFVWGWILDRYVAGSHQKMRIYRWIFVALFLFSLPLAATHRLAAPGGIKAWIPLLLELFFEMFISSGFVMVSLHYATWVYTGAHAGLIAGLGAGSWGAAVALAMPYVGRLFDQKRWEEAFLWATVFPVVGLIVWWIGSSAGASNRLRPPVEG
ncbi:MAG: MFS transporter [Acidobacteriota bacterium]